MNADEEMKRGCVICDHKVTRYDAVEWKGRRRVVAADERG
jgi:hypothetical protein